MELSGKVALVTGGVNGFGRALVERLHADGAEVVVFDIDPEGAEKLSETLADRILYVSCDVSVPERVASAVEEVVSSKKKVDILVNNAGILFSAPLVRFGSTGFEAHSIEDWDKVIKTNLSSVFYITAQIAQRMASSRTKGLILNISSIAGNGNPGQSAYAAAKAGVNALTATWAHELGPLGIRVAAIAPGFFDTPSTRRTVSEPLLKEVKKRIPLRRLGRSEELVDAVLYIIGNDFYNGKVLELDGGHVIC
jgi:3-oxoacyl-[acyl-carrier protein] reductase